jgi:hypothetical protein
MGSGAAQAVLEAGHLLGMQVAAVGCPHRLGALQRLTHHQALPAACPCCAQARLGPAALGASLARHWRAPGPLAASGTSYGFPVLDAVCGAVCGTQRPRRRPRRSAVPRVGFLGLEGVAARRAPCAFTRSAPRPLRSPPSRPLRMFLWTAQRATNRGGSGAVRSQLAAPPFPPHQQLPQPLTVLPRGGARGLHHLPLVRGRFVDISWGSRQALPRPVLLHRSSDPSYVLQEPTSARGRPPRRLNALMMR